MPSPQDGKAGTIVPPSAPGAAHDADNAEPGAVETAKAAERQSQTGKYGSTPTPPYKPPKPGTTPPEKKLTFIEIQLVDQDNKPVAGERYRIKLPDGNVQQGSLDSTGSARVDNIDPGNCEISFPNLDADAWNPK